MDPDRHGGRQRAVLQHDHERAEAASLDAEFAKSTEFERPLVNSVFTTLGLMIGMSVHNTTQGTTVANLGMTDVRFPAPVFAGDSAALLTTVVTARPSRSRADAGIVTIPSRSVQPKRCAGGHLRARGAHAAQAGGSGGGGQPMRLRGPLFAPADSGLTGRAVPPPEHWTAVPPGLGCADSSLSPPMPSGKTPVESCRPADEYGGP